ncbi:uncharacterized protein LOC110028995 isoform X2 [Phalaenopsis equestris]|uniref:uncharacterized protein LOC110028995 isoform X2 n=1 Tax=Phalaenopsis equestris TaxID=78828 RepID=UPI0009E2C264|nr:uncharacterized protein LOC110028995 isoform X2 [Phalaenopsis equestris]
MERTEPTFVPEWYKVSHSSAQGSGNSNHQSGLSLHTDEHNIGFSSRNRLTVSVCDNDAPRSLSFSERSSSSFRRSTSSNGYIVREKDFSSRAYNSFSRNHRDRDRDREKDFEIHDRDRPFDDGFGDYPDVLVTGKSEKDSLKRSQSMLSRRRADPWQRRASHDSSNGFQSMGGSGRVNGTSKSSFEREFPSLGAEEKHAGSDVIRASSPGLNTAFHNLSVSASSIIGADGWTSVLAEVPIVGSNGLIVSSSFQTSSAMAPAASSVSTGLNMAETVAQAPARARTAPQLPSDSQKMEELHRQQILKLRPVTPSMPKNLSVNLSEKSKTKGSKMAEYNTVKVGQHLSSQLFNHAVRSNIKSDAPKTSQPGNFHVLNREKNGLSLTDKDNLHPRNGSRVVASPGGGIPPAAILDLSGQPYSKLNVNGKTGAPSSSSFGEKKLPYQAQNRNDFFNSLRKKSSSSQENTKQDPGCKVFASPSLEKLNEVVAVGAISDKEKDLSTLQHSVDNGSFKAVEEPERLAPDEEEAAFLRSLGWEENAGEEALTPEEIESFLSEYEKKIPVSKLKIAGCSSKLSSSSDTQVETSFC